MGEKERLEAAASSVSTASTERPKSTRKRDPRIQHYYSTPEIMSRLERVEMEWGIENRSALTRWLLEYALDAVDRGKLKPKMVTVTKAELD